MIQERVPDQNISVSVAMCTYNGAAFVEEQLLSVLKQTYPLKEFLIFDDASTDGTVAILQQYATKHPVIRLHINEKNTGYTKNFQQAVMAATGDAIAVCDQDDIWVAEKIEKLVAAWQPGVPLIYCYSSIFKTEEGLPAHPQRNAICRRFEGTDGRKIFMINTVSGHAMLFRKDFLKMVLPFSDKVTYDWWMSVVAAYNGGVQYLPEILVFQRMHTRNITIYRDDKYSKKEEAALFKQTIIDNCTLFATAPNMPEADRLVALRFAELVKESLNHTFYRPLFLFILKYRKVLFNYKIRKVGIFSHVKNGYRKTKNY